MNDLRYPIGPLDLAPEYSAAERAALLDQLARLPDELRSAVSELDDARLDTPYREGGWTVRQVVHHVADSHLNGYVRLKLALTEDEPEIRPYPEALWAEVADSRLPVEVSLRLLEALHSRWTAIFESLAEPQWRRTYIHPERREALPETRGLLTLEQSLANYAWHGRHHTAHVTELRRREGW